MPFHRRSQDVPLPNRLGAISFFTSVTAAEASTLDPYTSWIVFSGDTIIAGGVTGATSGPPPVFSSIANAMAAVLDAFTTWVVFGTGDVIIAGGTTGATSGPIYPARDGTPVSTADLEESATGGFEIVSGTVTPALDAIGVGYVNGEVVTMDGGVIDVGSQTVGTRASIVVDTVDGPGGILTWHVSAGTAGHGDYYFLPTLGSPISTTASAAGTGATFTLTQAVTGVSRNGAGELVIEPHRSAGTPSSVVLALPVLHAIAGWWMPEVVGIHVKFGTQTQLAAEANAEKSTRVGIRTARQDTPRDVSDWHSTGLHYESAGSWAAYAQRGTDLNQNVRTLNTPLVVSGDELHVESFMGQSTGAPTAVVAQAQIQDALSASKVDPVAAASISVTGWTFDSATSDPDDAVLLYLEFLSGLVAGDRSLYTIKSLQGRGKKWNLRA